MEWIEIVESVVETVEIIPMMMESMYVDVRLVRLTDALQDIQIIVRNGVVDNSKHNKEDKEMAVESGLVMDAVLDKKMDNYNYDTEKNIKAPEELTVTITLHEYRDLVGKVATRESAIKQAEVDRYTRNTENEKLKKEVQELKEKLYDLQEKYCKPVETGAGIEKEQVPVEEDN